jgi:hypothetical protein
VLPGATAPSLLTKPLVAGVSKPAAAVTAKLKTMQTALARQIVPTGKSASVAALLRPGGIRLRIRAPAAGMLLVSWYRRPARNAPLILVARGSRRFARPATATVAIKPTVIGRHQLKKHTPTSARASLWGAGSDPISATHALRLRR